MPGTPSRVPVERGRSLTRTRRGRVNALRSLGVSRARARSAGVFPVRPHSVEPLARPLVQEPPTSPYHLSRRAVGRLGLLTNAGNNLLYTREGRVKAVLPTPTEAENEENHSPGFYERKRAATRAAHTAYRKSVKAPNTTRSTSKGEAYKAVVNRKSAKRTPRSYGLPTPVGSNRNGPNVLKVLEKRGFKSAPRGYTRKYKNYMGL